MQKSVAIFTFSVWERKYPFWTNLVRKIKIVTLSWSLKSRLLRICKFNDNVQFCSFWPEMSFWSKFGKKSTFSVLSWNLVIRLIRISRIQWWCSLFFVWPKIPFLDKFDPQIQNCLFKVKFVPWLIRTFTI